MNGELKSISASDHGLQAVLFYNSMHPHASDFKSPRWPRRIASKQAPALLSSPGRQSRPVHYLMYRYVVNEVFYDLI
eukprot:scaffold107408_cov16-Prasinocladus_malaysianus.AAC.4